MIENAGQGHPEADSPLVEDQVGGECSYLTVDQLLGLTRHFLKYERITLTRFTTCYISLILAVCIVQNDPPFFCLGQQCAREVLHRRDYREGRRASGGFAFVKDDVLMVCDRLPLPGDLNACWPLTSGVAVSVNAVSGNTTLGYSADPQSL